jgi:hypothetical protein
MTPTLYGISDLHVGYPENREIVASMRPETGDPDLDGPRTALFVLYDYSFRPDGTATKEEALDYAHGTGIVCSDEFVLHPDPYPTREAWCHARVEATERRLAATGLPTVLVNHFPLVREPTRVLRCIREAGPSRPRLVLPGASA